MQTPKATETLRTHNAWRRGNDDSIGMANPTELGIAIDTVLASHEDMQRLLCECRGFIDDIVPGCSAGHDILDSLKRRIDSAAARVVAESNPSDQRAASAPTESCC